MSTNKVYEIVTNRIIEGLKQGKIPWQRPWNVYGLPMNYISKKPYRGINTLLLSLGEFKSPYYLTKKQVLDKKGRIRPEEFKKSQIVTYFKMFVTADANNPDKVKKIPMLRFYEVWNIEQTDLPIPAMEEVFKDNNVIEAAQKIVDDMKDKPDMVFNCPNSAYYSPSEDKLNMPEMKQFIGSEQYYMTLFHELAHSTGHPSRLDRDMSGHFGNADYSKEELIAEITASMIGSHLGEVSKELETTLA